MQAPTKYELVINLNTAKAFSITVSPQQLTRAGEMRITALFAAVHESACGIKQTGPPAAFDDNQFSPAHKMPTIHAGLGSIPITPVRQRNGVS